MSKDIMEDNIWNYVEMLYYWWVLIGSRIL